MKRKREETICVYGADCIFPHCEFSHEKHHNNILCPKEYRHIYNKYMDYVKCEDKACTFAHEKSTEKCKFARKISAFTVYRSSQQWYNTTEPNPEGTIWVQNLVSIAA